MIVIIDSNQIAQLQMSSQTSSLASHALHSTSISEKDVRVICDKREAILVEDSRGVCLGNGQTDCVAETLTKRPSGDFNAGSVVGLWMARGDAVYLTEVLDVVKAERIAEEMKEGILQHASVAVAVITILAVLWAEQPCSVDDSNTTRSCIYKSSHHGHRDIERVKFTHDSTNRSRLTQSGFFGLNVMNLLNKTWAAGAKPMGAPGCPELAAKVASTCIEP
jgi:hypothetical protein